MRLVLFKSTKGIYFKDVNHTLGKFESVWRGIGVGGHEITMELKVFHKVYEPAYWCYADLLGYKLEIKKEDKKLPSPLRNYQRIPDTEWYQGGGLDLDDDDKTAKDTYLFYLDFNDQRKDGYWGTTFVSGQISKDGKTLTVSHGGTVVTNHEIPNYPPYIPKAAFSVAWVLHRVGK